MVKQENHNERNNLGRNSIRTFFKFKDSLLNVCPFLK